MTVVFDGFYQWAVWLAQSPFMLLAIFTLPFAAIAYWRKTYPDTLLVALFGVACLLTLALLVQPDALLVVAGIEVALAVLAVVDYWTLPRQSDFAAERVCDRIVSLKKNHHVTLTLGNLGQREYGLRIRDGLPQEFSPSPGEFFVRLAGRNRATMHYEMKASRRGAFRISNVYVRVGSRFGLWKSYFEYPVETTVHVYPDMKQLAEYALLARTNRLSLMGVRRTRKIGQDNEFERLRDYTLDDNHKHIDWRATARRNKLTVKDFQTSQSQRLIFLVDCGRMMTNLASGLSLLDHSLNAMLMLSYVALRQGDSVGLLCFSDRIHSYTPPRSGMNQMNQLLHASFDRFPQLVESRYDQAFFYLSRNCRKRSLVILISNVIDEVNSHQIHQQLASLVGRHLPLGVLLRDHRLFDAAESVAEGDSRLYRAAAAAEILTWRHQVLRDLEHKGVLSLDVFPEDMTAPLVNRYLEIKARHLL